MKDSNRMPEGLCQKITTDVNEQNTQAIGFDVGFDGLNKK
jgi:hypothetical protein